MLVVVLVADETKIGNRMTFRRALLLWLSYHCGLAGWNADLKKCLNARQHPKPARSTCSSLLAGPRPRRRILVFLLSQLDFPHFFTQSRLRTYLCRDHPFTLALALNPKSIPRSPKPLSLVLSAIERRSNGSNFDKSPYPPPA